METPKFNQWSIVEVMGRLRLAGLVTEQVVAGQGFIRVDVPVTARQPPFSRLFGPSSIYSMTPVTEEMAKACAERFNEAPLDVYDIRATMAKLPKPAAEGVTGEDLEDDAGDFGDEP